jgi:hypothetical protein
MFGRIKLLFVPKGVLMVFVSRYLPYLAAFAVVLGVGITGSQAGLPPSFSPLAEIDTIPFYDQSSYSAEIPKPNDFLVHPVGTWPARYDEIIAYLEHLAESSDRVLIRPIGRTFEGRTLYNVFISAPENIAALDDLQARMAEIADPDNLMAAGQLDKAVAEQPGFAWIGFSIHGDEISGCDAGVQLAYHLAAANDEATLGVLKNLVIILEPSENPDGRERYLSMLETYKSATPNYDMQSMQHRGVWPSGRTNHYWFDLNRDWILQTQPETRGRTKTILTYNPILVVDVHEMGADDNFLFSPPREPINYNTPASVLKWWKVFAKDQAGAFDKRGWPYYTGEWHEQWYLGYGSAWPTFFGAVGILYEQAGVDGQAVRQPGDYILTYHQSLNQQFTSAFTNLQTAAKNRVALLKDYHTTRRSIVDEGARSGLTFLFVPGQDTDRLHTFIRTLLDQGIRVDVANEAFTVGAATDIYRTTHNSKRFPKGTYLVSTAQPHGALARAMLEFDPRFKQEILDDERRSLEKHGETKMYEVTAWSPALAYDLDAYMTTASITAPFTTVREFTEPTGELLYPDAEFGFLIDMEGERTYHLLKRLFDEQFTVYVSEKPFTVEGRSYRAGALLLRKRGNPKEMPNRLGMIAEEVGITIHGVNSGYSSDGSMLGAPTFTLLAQPKVAILCGSPLSSGSAGSIWFTIDEQMRIPHSLLRIDQLGWTDLSQYNVLIMPSTWGGGLGEVLGKQGTRTLNDWVSDGGTLIAIGTSAAWAADTATGLSRVRLRSQVLDKLGLYSAARERELAAEAPNVDTMALYYPDKANPDTTEDETKKSGPVDDAFKEAEEFADRFSPGGTILRADLDTEHWLAFGMGNRLPVMTYSNDVFLAASPVTTVARFTPNEADLRLSGLLWPEARQRWAGSAWATRERKGSGQVILFATDPNMRAYFYGTRQMLLNAVLFGPGYTSFDSPYGRRSPPDSLRLT